MPNNKRAGDAMGVNARENDTAHGMQFTTRDNDNDRDSNINCATHHENGGNWFNKCFLQNLNGQYRVVKYCTFTWIPFKTEPRCETFVGNFRSQLKGSKMMIRPKI